MDLKTVGPLLHTVLCTLTGVLFVAFFVSLAAAPSLRDTAGVYHHDSWLAPALLLVGVAILFQIALGIWVGIDANRRGMNGFLWGALTCFTCVVGLIVYLISTQSSTGQSRGPGSFAPPIGSFCPECGAETRAEFLACPRCGASLKGACPECGRFTEPGWKFCSYCRTRLDNSRRSERSGGGEADL